MAAGDGGSGASQYADEERYEEREEKNGEVDMDFASTRREAGDVGGEKLQAAGG